MKSKYTRLRQFTTGHILGAVAVATVVATLLGYYLITINQYGSGNRHVGLWLLGAGVGGALLGWGYAKRFGAGLNERSPFLYWGLAILVGALGGILLRSLIILVIVVITFWILISMLSGG